VAGASAGRVISFDTVPKSQDEENRRTPYALISRNCEFPDPATIEWHDGQDYDGGAEIVAVNLRRDRISIKLGSANGDQCWI